MAFNRALDKEIDETLKVNSKFAKAFEIRKQREEVQNAKKKAQELNVYSGDEGSSSESEDSEAELLTRKAESKFLKVLTMIRKGDSKLKDPAFQAFSDSDFETSSVESDHKEKPVRYKELVTNRIVNPESSSFKSTEKGKEKQIKDDFLSAVQDWEKDVENEPILVTRKTSKKEKKEEDFGDFIKSKAKDSEDIQAIQEYWEKPAEGDDLFLKDFMLKKLWEDPKDQLMTYDEIVDGQDATKTEETEKFETAFNFRFEEEGFEKLKSNS